MIIITNVHIGTVTPLCMHFLNMCNITLISDDNIMLLS